MCRHKELDEAQFVRFRQLVEDEEQVDVNCIDDVYRSTPLIRLCKNNQSDGLYNCVRHRPDIQINHTDPIGRNALIWLCWWSTSEKMLEVAQLLIANGIDVNQTDRFGRNALMWLCGWSESDKILEVARLLIDNGININQIDKDGRNALMALCWESKSDQILEVAQLLIANGIEINQTNLWGENAAHLLTDNLNVSKSKKREILALLQR